MEVLGALAASDGKGENRASQLEGSLMDDRETEIDVASVNEVEDFEEWFGVGIANNPSEIKSSDNEQATLIPPPVLLHNSIKIESYPYTGVDLGPGGSFFCALEELSPDEWAVACENNPYWPFNNSEEWELALWMVDTSLSHEEITAFLKLQYVHVFDTRPIMST